MPATFGSGYSVYDNKDLTRNHLVGLDFSRGALTHSIRFSYLKFQNQIADATSGNSSLPFNDLERGDFYGGDRTNCRTESIRSPKPAAK